MLTTSNMAPSNVHTMGVRSLQPVTATSRLARGLSRATCCSTSEAVTARPGRPSRIQQLSCRDNFFSPGIRGPLRLQRLQALSFQMVTADHDNGGEENPGLSAQAMDSSSSSSSEWQGREGGRQMLADTWQSLQEGATELRQRGVLETAKQGFQETKEKVRRLDAKQLVSGIQSSPLSVHGARWWRTSDPWIKWPLAIFVTFYLLVTVIFGPAVSQDLMPLWILGPLTTAFVIWQFHQLARASCALAEKTAPSRELLRSRSLALYRDAKEGTLPEKTKLLAETKLGNLRQAASSKGSELSHYVESGQAATDAKQYIGTKSNEVWEWAADKYADVMEWWRPKGRTLARFLKRIF